MFKLGFEFMGKEITECSCSMTCFVGKPYYEITVGRNVFAIYDKPMQQEKCGETLLTVQRYESDISVYIFV